MFRLLAALLVGGALWLGYDWLTSDVGNSPDPSLQDLDLAGLTVDAEIGASAMAAPALDTGSRGAAVEGQADPHSSSAAADAVSLLQGGDADAVWSALRDGEGSGDGRVTRALSAMMSKSTPESALGLLGSGNAFLHSEEGRKTARKVIGQVRAQEADKGVASLTRFLELCMRGPIEKSDAAARAVVDEGFAAIKPLLMRTVLDPADMSRAKSYKVQPGDALERIAKRFRKAGHKVESGTLAAFNRISDPRKLRAGQVLKIPVEPIHTVVEKSSFLQVVYVGDVIFRLYWIGHGKEDCTPETTFTIGTKKENPDWYADGKVIPYGHPDNVLGDYFVKFLHDSYTGFGVHGTSHPESIGTMASAGCIRMYDADIEDYFHLVPRGSSVEIRASR